MDISKLDTDLISRTDMEDLTRLYPSLRHDWEVRPMFRTETEARVSVLNQIHHPTPHAKYWQSVKEQQVFFGELIYLSFDYRRKKIELKQLERDIQRETDNLKMELLNIDIEQKRYEILFAEKVAAERTREIKQWAKIKEELIQHHPDKINTENADEGVYQLKSYAKRFILEMLNSGNNLGAGDAQNVIGKAVTVKNRCKEMNIWDEVKSELGLTPVQLKALGE